MITVTIDIVVRMAVADPYSILCLEFNIICPFHHQSSPVAQQGRQSFGIRHSCRLPAWWERDIKIISDGVWEVWEGLRSPRSRGHKSGARSYWAGDQSSLPCLYKGLVSFHAFFSSPIPQLNCNFLEIGSWWKDWSLEHRVKAKELHCYWNCNLKGIDKIYVRRECEKQWS